MKWAYGVTTVPARLQTTFPRTLESLRKSGFDEPRLFIDGSISGDEYRHLGLEITARYPKIRTFGNWVLSLAELYIRYPNYDRYAIFQDDMVTSLYLREYLDSCRYPDRGYWNLYTFPQNQELINGRLGWQLSNQWGLGAVALVFSRQAVVELLKQEHMVTRPQDVKGWRGVDGGIVTAFKKMGWQEYVHNPSLVQHTGTNSSMGNNKHPTAPSFKGENFDLRTLTKSNEVQFSNTSSGEAWELEKLALEKAINEDILRSKATRNPREASRLNHLINVYRQKLDAHMKLRTLK